MLKFRCQVKNNFKYAGILCVGELTLFVLHNIEETKANKWKCIYNFCIWRD